MTPLPPHQQAPIFLLITVLLMFQPLSTDLYLASLPYLSASFHSTPSSVQMTLSLFVITFGMAQLIVGPLSDRYGRRPILLTGLTIYMCASLFCFTASSITLLIIGRLFQAIGCCAAVVTARTLIRDAYAVEHNASVMAKASTWMSLAPIFGPILGGYLQAQFGWQGAFATLSLLSAIMLGLAYWILPETIRHKNPQATHLRGLLENGRLILSTPNFWRYVIPGALSYGTIFTFISASSFVLIGILHVPTKWFGYCFGLAVIGYMSGAFLCQKLIARYGNHTTLLIGTTLSLASGSFLLITVLLGIAHWATIVTAGFFTMCAHGINFPIAQSGSIAPFPRQAGMAAGLMGTGYMIIAFSIGTLVGATHNGSLYPIALIAFTSSGLLFLSTRYLIR